MAMGTQLTGLTKDTSIDAFLAPDSPTRIYRDQVREVFGLEDAVVIAVTGEGADGIFTPEGLDFVRDLSDQVGMIAGVDPERVTSLSTEKNIYANGEEIVIERFLENATADAASARAVRDAVYRIPLYQGLLVSNDGRGTLIAAEIIDGDRAETIYQEIRNIAAVTPDGIEVHIAGEGAAQGYLAAYIDADAKVLQPIAFLAILLVIGVAFRTLFAVIASIAVIAVTLTGALGSMAALGIPYFAITGALPVILIGISIVDAVHILSVYYSKSARHAGEGKRQIILQTMVEIWRPVFLTTLTTIAGFAAITATATMPPMQYFALFAMVGLVLALLASLTVLPCLLLVYRRHDSPVAERRAERDPQSAGWLPSLGHNMAQRHIASLAVLAVLVTGFGLQANQLSVDRKLMSNFRAEEPIRVADEVINRGFAGSNYIDIVVESREPEGILNPQSLQRIEALQRYAEGLPHVEKSIAITDYLKLMNRSLSGDDPYAYQLPQSHEKAAQYMLLYSASADPSDFEDEIDVEFQKALVRVHMTTDRFSEFAPAVENLRTYIAEEFADDLNANLSGRVTLAHDWIAPLGINHALSVAASLLAVTLVSMLVFRSFTLGILTIVPVALTLLSIYGVMAMTDIWLEPATFMFAAIALGLGVDFPIHMIDRMQYWREQGLTFFQAIERLYEGPARALFINCVAIAAGFSLLMLSTLPTINRFGLLTAVALVSGFVTSILFLPAMVRMLRPRRLFPSELARPNAVASGALSGNAALVFAVTVGIAAWPSTALAQTLSDGDTVAARMEARAEGATLRQTLIMTMSNSRGTTRTRRAELVRLKQNGVRRTMIRFLAPGNIRGTSFLTFDYEARDKADDQWIFLPALRRERRISANDRGDYFFSTDFTYEDIKDATKFDPADYRFVTLRAEKLGQRDTLVVSLLPQSPEISRELGYGRVQAWIDPSSWMPLRADYWDVAGNRLKTVRITSFRRVSGIWTPLRIEAANHKTGHKTVFSFSQIDYSADIGTSQLSVRALKNAL
ncbi:MAG: outer membrane lipoprotein-sorting protein [Erythrobacter sp.]|uniref:outer membrane lipoprotein-sorting protein n=1 Tax=Erythrobacter sp. TaxID=1042 RepID=UPI00260C7765|nr:outer membrane lipoprotein-sorting protein [Erythrobacter sp.]MDJ0979177.1 outer membrane lipoprotein-sorting protein [Erythrobacter sp.]